MRDDAHSYAPGSGSEGFTRVPGRAGFTYPEPGATWTGTVPTGFRRLRVSTPLGSGDAVFSAAAQALMEWRLHRRMGVTVAAEAERAAPGVQVTVGLGAGPLRVHGPCRVVWTVSEEHRAGWAYGTLSGHPVCGEEAFLVTRGGAPRDENGAKGEGGEGGENGTVRLTVLAFSRPAAWWTRAAGPLVPLFQHGYARRCGLILRHLAQSGEKGG